MANTEPPITLEEQDKYMLNDGIHKAIVSEEFLLFFDKLYDRFTDMEKKTFMKSFLEEVSIYEAEQEDGRILRSLKFRFPVFFNDQELYELDWDKVPLNLCSL